MAKQDPKETTSDLLIGGFLFAIMLVVLIFMAVAIYDYYKIPF